MQAGSASGSSAGSSGGSSGTCTLEREPDAELQRIMDTPLLSVSTRVQAGSASGSSAGSSGGSSGTGTLERDLVGSGAAPADGALFSPTNHFLDFSFKNLELLGERNREAAQAMAGLCPDPASAPGEAAAGSSQDLGSEPSACFDPEAGLEAASSGEGLDAQARVRPSRGKDTGVSPLSASFGSWEACSAVAAGPAPGAQGPGRRPAEASPAGRSADRGHLLARPKRSSA